MNNYIELNGYKYATAGKKWVPVPTKPGTARYTWDSRLDVTYGPGYPMEWQGEIRIDINPAEGYGGPLQIKDVLELKGAMDFRDHYGDYYRVHVFGKFPQQFLSVKWDSPSNVMFVNVRIVRE